MNTTPLYPQAVVDAVKKAMDAANVNETALAEASGISYTTLWRRLRGVTPFNVLELASIAAALDTSVEALTSPERTAS